MDEVMKMADEDEAAEGDEAAEDEAAEGDEANLRNPVRRYRQGHRLSMLLCSIGCLLKWPGLSSKFRLRQRPNPQ